MKFSKEWVSRNVFKQEGIKGQMCGEKEENAQFYRDQVIKGVVISSHARLHDS